MSKLEQKEAEQEIIRDVIREFYQRAFADGIISHFFFGKNHDDLVRMQSHFTLNMLGYHKNPYPGRSLRQVHASLPLSDVHFDRRRVILENVLSESSLPLSVQLKWLSLEERLRPQIVRGSSGPSCSG